MHERCGGPWRLRLAVLLVLVSCASTRLAPIGSEPGAFRPQADERELWAQSARLAQALHDKGLIQDGAALDAYLDGVAARLLPEEFVQTEVRVSVRVIEDPHLNAFALPDGQLFLHVGMLARMENEAQLATVLGHEIAHVLWRHAVREARLADNRRRLAGVLAGVLAAGAAAGGQSSPDVLGLGEALGELWTLAAVSGYSRELEFEADQAGLEAMIHAGYDPGEATRVFELMKQELDELDVEEPFFFASHPRLDERIEHYEQLLGRSGAAAAPAQPVRNESEFAEATVNLLLTAAELDLSVRRPNAAKAAVDRHLALRPGTGRAHHLLGEIHQREPRDLAAALSAYRMATALDAGYAEPWLALGLLLREEQRPAEARDAFERYLALAPEAVDRPIVEGYLAEALVEPPPAASP
jgi:predicted Zn-dependent protease